MLSRREFMIALTVATSATIVSCAPKSVRDYVWQEGYANVPQDGETLSTEPLLSEKELKDFYTKEFVFDSEINFNSDKHKQVMKSTIYHDLLLLGVDEATAQKRAENTVFTEYNPDLTKGCSGLCIQENENGLGLGVTKNHIEYINTNYSGMKWAKLALDLAHESTHLSVFGRRDDDEVKNYGVLGSQKKLVDIWGFGDNGHISTGIIDSLITLPRGDNTNMSIPEELFADWSANEMVKRFFDGIISKNTLSQLSVSSNYPILIQGVVNTQAQNWKDFLWYGELAWENVSDFHINGELWEFYHAVGINFLSTKKRIWNEAGHTITTNLSDADTAALGVLVFTDFALNTSNSPDKEVQVTDYFIKNDVTPESILSQSEWLLTQIKNSGLLPSE